jgi:phosphoserine aminotransferase
MNDIFNFSAGPAVLPKKVLQQVQSELVDYLSPDGNVGVSVMEMSHRSAAFMDIATRAEADLRTLLAIPDNYKILFLQGGATLQFSAIPLNLAAAGDRVDYVHTGQWANKAIKEAKRYADVNIIASAENTNFTSVPDIANWQFSDNSKYVHTTHNETIGGVCFDGIPDVGERILVSDMSSCILSEPLDVSRFGLIYAGAQKNIGPAGLTIVIVRDDLLGNARQECPTLLNYQTHADADSMNNTPPTFAWYMAGKVFSHLLAEGGLAAAKQRNQLKAELLYKTIDDSSFYQNPVALANRSIMNVPFTLANAELDSLFLNQAKAAGLVELKGHRSVGGMRASIYNAMPLEGVQALCDFMEKFEKENG